MYRASVTIDSDVLAAIQETARTAPKEMRRAADRVATITRARLLADIATEPGAPKYPLRWKSDRQRRFVMAKLRREGNLPYQRTGRLIKGWRVVLEAGDGGIGTLVLENNVPYARYVQGDDAQPFHMDTGWRQAAPLVAKYREEATELLIDAWYRVVTKDVR